MNGFSQAEDFELHLKIAIPSFNGEEWATDSTDAVLESVECSGEVLSFGQVKRKNKGKSRRKNRRRHGGGHRRRTPRWRTSQWRTWVAVITEVVITVAEAMAKVATEK